MSSTPVTVPVPDRLSAGAAGERRVRDQARDAAVLMAFSAMLSVGFAAGFVLLASLGSGR